MHNGSLGRSPMHLLHRALQCADDCFLHDVPTDLTPRQLVVLLAVAETEGAIKIGWSTPPALTDLRLRTSCAASSSGSSFSAVEVVGIHGPTL